MESVTVSNVCSVWLMPSSGYITPLIASLLLVHMEQRTGAHPAKVTTQIKTSTK